MYQKKLIIIKNNIFKKKSCKDIGKEDINNRPNRLRVQCAVLSLSSDLSQTTKQKEDCDITSLCIDNKITSNYLYTTHTYINICIYINTHT